MKDTKLYVVDNSVVLKAFIEEPGTEKVEKLFAQKEKFEISLLVPDLFRYEFFNKMTKEYDEDEAFKAYRSFVCRQVSVIPLEEDIIRVANKLMAKYPIISFYDAAYHALAKAYRADLLTADEQYYEMTKGEGHIKLLALVEI